MALFDTPRTRRLKADYEALKGLKENSSIVDFQSFGDPPERYLVTYKGKGLIRKNETDPVEVADVHRVEIRLGIDYPRSRPDLQWLTSIYHPNISAVGAVCLGGYSTNWVPSLGLAELIEMLWEMVRYSNYDPKSAYNYAAGRWSETQTQYDFPLDTRALRDRLHKTVGDNVIKLDLSKSKSTEPPKAAPSAAKSSVPAAPAPTEDILIIDDNTPTPPTPPTPPQRTRPAPAIRPRPPADDDILIIE